MPYKLTHFIMDTKDVVYKEIVIGAGIWPSYLGGGMVRPGLFRPVGPAGCLVTRYTTCVHVYTKSQQK